MSRGSFLKEDEVRRQSISNMPALPTVEDDKPKVEKATWDLEIDREDFVLIADSEELLPKPRSPLVMSK